MNDKNRYIQLNGDPIHQPLWKSFWQAPDIIYPVIMTAFATAATAAAGSDASVTAAVSGINGFLFGSIFSRVIERFILTSDFFHSSFGRNFEGCIDKNPDNATPPTKPEHIDRSSTVSFVLGTMATVAGIMELPDILRTAFSLAASPEQADLSRLFFEISALARILRYGCASHRFARVARGDWAILDHTPEKKKQEQEDKAPSFLQPVPDPV